MTSIGFLIPEFPGQTHAFFMRERAELANLGVHTELISTQRPVEGEGMAQHSWASEAAKDTHYLFPIGVKSIAKAFFYILMSGPAAWWRSVKSILSSSELTFKERLQLPGLLLIGSNLKQWAQRTGVEHIHVHSCANSAHVAMFARLLGGPSYSITLHGPMQDYGGNQAEKWRHASFAIIITKELVGEVKNKLPACSLPPIHLAPMGVNTDSFRRSSTYLPPQRDQQVHLVSCGRLNFVKAHDDLVRVVALLRDKGVKAHLRICGAADSQSATDGTGYVDSLESLIAELGVECSVDLLGSISEERVKEELENAHFFCLASLKEPLGVATMEAMAMEMPVIVTRSPGVLDLIESGKNGVLVEPRSPTEFAETIENLLEAPDAIESLGKQGRLTVLQRFSSKVSAKAIFDGVRQTS
ncbi:glycosyltransferase family 4 protein [Porticoccus sp. W117]|uniref:exopolysaccharide biosynthesis GT4 family glycosyltransferase EpsE n=1 Tax=Porticoccus sp. W117 TaxID=3054777 RepID=UPI002596070B|nr:exopolysaccharide biosynthesis GT4 family glycosyltransferase EpsE [Porticoccus sp. W117]MDM3870625.1 glycosyltransferase family 4 protein [Porticoccus sp. W117]